MRSNLNQIIPILRAERAPDGVSRSPRFIYDFVFRKGKGFRKKVWVVQGGLIAEGNCLNEPYSEVKDYKEMVLSRNFY